MTLKLKRGLLTPAADAAPEDFIIVTDNDADTSSADDFTSAAPMEQLEHMERYAQLALQTVASGADDVRATEAAPQRMRKGAYVHYIPQFYLH